MTCGNMLVESAIYCSHCGEKNKTNDSQEILRDNDKIMYVISGINNPSMTFSGANGHWLIIFTERTLYFIKTDWSSWYQGNPMGPAFGLAGALVVGLVKHAMDKRKVPKTPNLSEILSNAKKYYTFSLEHFDQISVRSNWRNNIIFLERVEPKTLEILVDKKQYNDFVESMKKNYNHEFSRF